MQNENKSYKAEIDSLQTQLASVKSSSHSLVKSSRDLVPSQQGDMSTIQQLQFAHDASEKKYSKLKADFQDLMSERRQAVEALRSSSIEESLFASNAVDLAHAITVLCDKVTSSETSRAVSINEDRTRTSLASAEADKVKLQMELQRMEKLDDEKAQLLEKKDRVLSALQEENLHFAEKLNETRKERDKLKARNNALQKQACTANVHGLQPSSAAKFKTDFSTNSSAKTPRQPLNKSSSKYVARTDKENSAHIRSQTPIRSSSKRNASAYIQSPAPTRSLSKRQHASAVKEPLPAKKPKITEEPLGFSADPCDEPTENCKQS